MGNVLPELVSIPEGVRAPQVRQARRLLEGSYKSVDGLLEAVQELDKRRREGNGSAKGRKSERERDLLRAAIVFTSAGIDASMTRLVKEAGKSLILDKKEGAYGQYREFLKQEIPPNSIPSGLRDILIDEKLEESVVDYYLTEKTRASFQGSGDLDKRVRALLGLPKSVLDGDTKQELDSFFTSRNRIVHAMDYEDEGGKRTRRNHHDETEVQDQCFTVLNLAAQLINETAQVLNERE